MTWRGCPHCGADPIVEKETPAGVFMVCPKCPWAGPFRDCWDMSDETPLDILERRAKELKRHAIN